MRTVGALLLTFLSTGGALAQAQPGEAARRKVVVPYIRSLTNCVAKVAADDAEAVTAFDGGTLDVYLRQQLRYCGDQTSSLLNEYDQVYGEGQGAAFIKGPYSADLRRAVMTRIGSTLERKSADLRQQREEQERQAAAERVRAEQQAREEAAERDRQQAQARAEQDARLAEAKQKAEVQKAAAIQAEADAKAAAAKAEAEKQARLEDGRHAMGLLRDKFDICALKQLHDLVKSGEAATVLSSAALTICSAEIATMNDAAASQWSIEQGRKPSPGEVDAIDTSLRDLLRERTTAYAVQAKAGAGPFSGAAASDPLNNGRF